MLSVIIPTYNEAGVLDHSLRAILDAAPECNHEFILVNDCSTDDSLGIVNRIMPTCHSSVRVVTNPERIGASGSRRAGVEKASGDILCFIDAHVWPDPGFFDTLVAAVEEHPLSIVSPGITQHRLTRPWTPLPEKPRATNYGGGFTFTVRKLWFYMSVNRRRKRWQERRGAYACGMTMTKTLYEHLGGWANLPGFWSSSDVTMCIKAWYMDVPIVIETATQHYHGVKGFGPHETPKWHEVINRLYAARVLFSEEQYEEFWKPGLLKRFGRHWTDEFDQILGSAEIEAEHEHVRNRIKHDDEEFMESFVYPRFDKAGLPREP